VWYRRAAAQGHVVAQFTLGGRYADGRGVAQDPVEAVVWFRRAAEQGYASAQVALGVIYADGRGVAPDAAEAVRWYRRAAAQSHIARAPYDFRGEIRNSLNDLVHGGVSGGSILFGVGQGLGPDDVTSHMWLDLAAARSTGEVRDLVIHSRDTVAERMTQNEIADAQRRAREWDAAHPREPSPSALNHGA
jgi:hypothetical protein